jgi:hypothetical protein
MIIKVTDTQTANKLSNSMSSGNCIVLYHMHGCPYCVQMMPDWTNFMQVAKQQLPGLTVGEVERSHVDKLGETGVSSFPTIKFYKAGEPSSMSAQQNTMQNTKHIVPKQNNFKDILKGIMGQLPGQNTVSNPGDNSIMFEDSRTTDKLIKFAKDNLAKSLNTKGKKAKKTKKTAINTLTKSKKTKKNAGKKPQELTNSLAQLSANANRNSTQNSNMMDLPKYKKAKKTDAKTAKKLKNQIFG